MVASRPGFSNAFAGGCAGCALIVMLVTIGLFGFFGKDKSLVAPTGISVAAASGCTSPRLPKIANQEALATTIDAYIRGIVPRSPLVGAGSNFVKGGVQNGINPIWAVAIAQKESGFGAAGIATKGTNNSFGRTATSSQPGVELDGRRWYKYDSFIESPFGQSEYLKRKYIDQGLVTMRDIVYTHSPPRENNTEQYIKDIEATMAKIVGLSGSALDCNTGTALGNVPPGSDIKNCLNVRKIPEPIPVKSNDLAHTTLVRKLELLWDKNKTWRVTEACPPSIQHADRNHYNGRAIDIAIFPKESATEERIRQLVADVKAVGFDDILDEYHVDTKFKTAGHIHLEWHGN